jgi:hypothetical protein
MKTLQPSVTLGVCCLAITLLAHAGEQIVFTWVDANGVTHYSETPPEDTAVEAFQVELEQAPAAGPAQDADHYSVVKQAQRMEQSRLANERIKTERLRAEAEARRAAAARQPYVSSGEDDTERYYPVQPYFYGYRPGYRPGYKPGHRPGGRPGHRPGHPTQLPEPGRGSVRTRPVVGIN